MATEADRPLLSRPLLSVVRVRLRPHTSNPFPPCIASNHTNPHVESFPTLYCIPSHLVTPHVESLPTLYCIQSHEPTSRIPSHLAIEVLPFLHSTSYLFPSLPTLHCIQSLPFVSLEPWTRGLAGRGTGFGGSRISDLGISDHLSFFKGRTRLATAG